MLLETSQTWSVCLQARDPIPQLRKYILEEGLVTEAQLKEVEAAVVAEVDDAVKFADESPKPVRVHPGMRAAPCSVMTRWEDGQKLLHECLES